MAEQEPREADRPADRLTLAAAAARTGRHPEAIRALIRRGKLRAIRGNDGRLLVELPPPEEPAELGEPGREPTPAGRPADRLAATQQQVADLEGVLLELRDELRALGEAHARAEERATTLRELVDREREIARGLREELAELRRPWWVKLLGRGRQ